MYCIRAKDKNAKYAIHLSDMQIIARQPIVYSMNMHVNICTV